MANQSYDKETLPDGIVVFVVKSTSREHMDAWYQDVAAVFAQARANNTPVRMLYDVRKIDLITPYSVQKAEDLNKLPVPNDWRVATLVKSSFLANMVNYVRLVSLQPGVREQSRIFSDEAEALAWLRQP
jgi:hypothetical protein